MIPKKPTTKPQADGLDAFIAGNKDAGITPKKTGKGGRPPKDAADRRQKFLAFYCTEEELERVNKNIEQIGLSFSTWARVQLKKEGLL